MANSHDDDAQKPLIISREDSRTPNYHAVKGDAEYFAPYKMSLNSPTKGSKLIGEGSLEIITFASVFVFQSLFLAQMIEMVCAALTTSYAQSLHVHFPLCIRINHHCDHLHKDRQRVSQVQRG